MIAFRGASLLTKSSIFSLMSKMITMPIIRRRAMKNVRRKRLTMYTSRSFGLSLYSLCMSALLSKS